VLKVMHENVKTVLEGPCVKLKDGTCLVLTLVVDTDRFDVTIQPLLVNVDNGNYFRRTS